MANRPQISPERKAMYYLGAVLMGIGFLLFLSNFFIMPMQMSRMPMFGPSQGPDPMVGFALRAVGGLVLMIIGGFVRGVGARGAAGSGLILDPEQAREDLKPWAQTAGGLVKDALDEVRGEGGHAGGNHAGGNHVGGDHAGGNHVGGDHAGGDHAGGDHAGGNHAGGNHVGGNHASGNHVGGNHASGNHASGDAPAGPVETVIKVRCPKCRTLNDEDAKFCKSCASAL